MTRRSNLALAVAITATVGLLAADLGSKEWASDNLSVEHPGTPPPVCEAGRNQRLRSEPVVLVEGLLEFSYAENCGAAFGLLDDSPSWIRRSVFGFAALAAAVFLFWLFWKGSGGPLFVYSVPLIVSGAVGNLIDRVRLGYVVDFIRAHYDEPFDLFWLSFDWAHFDRFEYPTFNVADITITVGVVLLIIDGVIDERRKKQEAEAEAKAEAKAAEGKGGKKKGQRKKGKAPESESSAESESESSTESESESAASPAEA